MGVNSCCSPEGRPFFAAPWVRQGEQTQGVREATSPGAPAMGFRTAAAPQLLPHCLSFDRAAQPPERV